TARRSSRFGLGGPRARSQARLPSAGNQDQTSAERMPVAVYLSMQRVRFSSPDAYEKFKVVFADTRNHLMGLPGFIHLTWWEHPDDPGWFNECSLWASKEALTDWHMNTYHKY